MTAPTASETKRRAVQVLLVEGQQPIKIVVDPNRLGDEHGFPESVLGGYPRGIPLDLDPSWPLNLDAEDEDELSVDLSFAGRICRCCIPWPAIVVVGAGLGGLPWRFDDGDATKPKKRKAHLRLVD